MNAPGVPQLVADVATILATLKDFQRRTVEHVFACMYGPGGVDRFLVADEVGLGKTLVAKGIVAKAVERLSQDPGKRIDIVYICANREIARQNIARLNIFGKDRISEANRLTLLPLHLHHLRSGSNFIAFTPGTALNLRGATGVVEERALLYCLLCDVWDLGGAAPKNVFQVGVGSERWDRVVTRVASGIAALEGGRIDDEVRRRFTAELDRRDQLRARFDELLTLFQRRRKGPERVPKAHKALRNALIGELREALAHACLAALDPDLIVLDEFQRFSALLGGADPDTDPEVAELGRQFLNYPGAKVLLLSATPYKSYTLTRESAVEDHYTDFLRTLRFLCNDPVQAEDLERCLAEFNEALFDLRPDAVERIGRAKTAVEARLRRHVVRTERLGLTADRDGLVESMPLPACRLEGADLQAFGALDALAAELDQPDVVEYWKSGPYFLNFMERDGYVLKRRLIEQLETGGTVGTTVDRNALRTALLDRRALANLQPLEPQNARLRALAAEVLDRGGWEVLWLPPSLPYYATPGTPYHEAARQGLTKVLVFSGWRFVPRAIAAALSYEAERRIAARAGGDLRYEDLSTRGRRGLWTFSVDERNQPRDLNYLSPLYPSPSLCELLDPLEEARTARTGARALDREALLRLAIERAAALLRNGPGDAPHSGDREDQRWYVAAMLQADLSGHPEAVRDWRARTPPWSAFVPAQDDNEGGAAGFRAHVERFFALDAVTGLGRPPGDLAAILAKAALGSPAVLALRAFRRLTTAAGVTGYPGWLLDAAARVGLEFRTLFNQPDATLLTRALYQGDHARYWEAVLDYCIAGNLQAVLDEHVHVLRESLGTGTLPPHEAIPRIAEAIIAALTLRAPILRVDDLTADKGLALGAQPIPFRCRSALRFDSDPGEDEGTETRADHVRVAFNSPFRPFVLASTAVGQEGLDFHLWCHAIFHWNLPHNPVDFEQREGRVHRFKGHVIRRGLAADLGVEALAGMAPHGDPWEHLFEVARSGRPAGQTDLIPYWIYNSTAGIKIRRYIPALPYSRDRVLAEQLRASLGAYRLVFGQPRQEDLLAFLQTTRDPSQLDLRLLAIDLAPPLLGNDPHS